jgi:serine protease Do
MHCSGFAVIQKLFMVLPGLLAYRLATRPRRSCIMNQAALSPGLAVFLSIAAFQTASGAEPSNLDLARRLNEAFVEVAEKVSPSVVVISVTQKPGSPSSEESDEGDDPLDFLPPEFRRRYRGDEPLFGQGSGIIIRKDGYILTNGHVVEDAEKIEVRLKDGRRFKATVRGVDPQSDVAVIKIDAKDLPEATLADSSKTRVGEFAIAIGAPFNLDYSVTFGHVSAKGRSNIVPSYAGGDRMDQDFIQTDANINPGNSGGPLVNIDGEVIGLNTLIRGLRSGIGFAIPSSLAKEVSDKLIADGKFTRLWLGVKIHSVKEDGAFRAIVKGIEDGVVVDEIMADGPAAKSELRASDVIVAVDGKPVSTAQQLRNEIRIKKVNEPVTLDVFRKGKSVKVAVHPGEWIDTPETQIVQRPTPRGADVPTLGLSVHALTEEFAKRFHVKMASGVLVVSVDKNSIAARSNIKAGDIITSINHQEVTNPRQFREAAKKVDLKKGALINLITGDTARFEILKEENE